MTDTPPLGRKLATGSALMLLLRATVRGLGFLSLIIVARLVPPEDIGIAALAATVILGVNIFQNLGMSVALIRKQEVTVDDYNTVWTLSLIRGFFKAVLIAVLAPYAADYFNEPRLTQVLYVLAVASLTFSAANIGIVDFQRQLQYRRLFQMSITVKLVYFVVVIGAAIVLQSYWALVAGIVAQQLTQFFLSYLLHDFRPRLGWKPDRELFAFSFWFWLHGIAAFFSNRSDTFVIGRILGLESLGVYSISQRISALASAEISGPVAQALRPGFALLAREQERLRGVYLNAVAGVVLIGAPLVVALICIPELIVRVLFGEQWLQAAPLVQIMAAAGLIRMIVIQNRELLFQAGRERFATGLALARLLILVPALVIGAINWGAPGAAAAVAISLVFQWGAGQREVSDRLQLGAAEFFGAIWKPVAAASVAGTVVVLCQTVWPAMLKPWPAAVQLVALAALVATVYAGIVITIWLVGGRPNDVVGKSINTVQKRLPVAADHSY